jgi:hypothetical protein
VSHEITLRRELESISKRIDGGQLKLQSGKLIEEVVVEDHTPGVAVSVDNETISVSFAEGSAMVFSVRPGATELMPLRSEPLTSTGFAEPPDPFPGEDQPSPPISVDVLGSYFLSTDTGSGRVVFLGKVWEATEDSVRAHLLIDADELEEVIENHTVLPGRRVKNQRPTRWL